MNQLASFLWIYTKKCQLKKGQMKGSAASLHSLQFQFEVIVLAVLLDSSSEQQCPDERAHFIFYARRNRLLAYCYGCIQINVTRKQL